MEKASTPLPEAPLMEPFKNAAVPKEPGRHIKARKAALFPGFPIDINRATRQELMLLPGVGKKTAERIIEKRAELGGFKTVDELTGVKWIGRVKLERIRSLVTVKAEAADSKAFRKSPVRN